MRGKECRLFGSCTQNGITPAYAGKRAPAPSTRPLSRDHPRVCGEKIQFIKARYIGAGSPPRMRGKDSQGGKSGEPTGITPAYAGKSAPCPEGVISTMDHPRVCGEKELEPMQESIAPGSPPRMRGKAARTAPPSWRAWITPAYAGKRKASFDPAFMARDHPRVCGEKGEQPVKKKEIMGSPPRMRGKDIFFLFFFQVSRITPAYAGKRLKRSHSIGHFSCILRLFHSVLHRASASGGSRAGPCAPPCLPAQNAVPV